MQGDVSGINCYDLIEPFKIFPVKCQKIGNAMLDHCSNKTGVMSIFPSTCILVYMSANAIGVACL